eukprot:SAG31_NODE_350_length_17241_cov_156.139715_7_plen_209_part_00
MSGCPAGYVAHDNKCYLFSLDQATFADAERACEILGGELTCIEDEEENTFVTQQLTGASGVNINDQFWIGAWRCSDSTNMIEATWAKEAIAVAHPSARVFLLRTPALPITFSPFVRSARSVLGGGNGMVRKIMHLNLHQLEIWGYVLLQNDVGHATCVARLYSQQNFAIRHSPMTPSLGLQNQMTNGQEARAGIVFEFVQNRARCAKT